MFLKKPKYLTSSPNCHWSACNKPGKISAVWVNNMN